MSSSHLAPTRSSLSATHEHHPPASSSDVPRHPFLRSYFARSAHILPNLLIAVLVSVFICCTYFAGRTWREVMQTVDQWRKVSCNLKPPIRIEPLFDSYRIVADVSIIGRNTTQFFPAYYSSFPNHTVSEQEAQQQKQSLTSNISFACWIKNDDTNSSNQLLVSLTEAHSASSLSIAWICTLLAAILALVVVTLVPTTAHANARNLQGAYHEMRAPPSAKAPHLSEKQATQICNQYADRVNQEQIGNDWSCAICLDDDDDDDRKVIKTVVLPCKHRFHRTCIKQWLWKGKGVCPLCNWDACDFLEKKKKSESESS